MGTLYFISVWLHILAAIVWLGGVLFVVMAVVPWLRQKDAATKREALFALGMRTRRIGWACFIVLFATGLANLAFRGVKHTSFVDPEWLKSPFGLAMALKFGAFCVILGLSAFHDFVVGPRATSPASVPGTEEERERSTRVARMLGRATAVVALVVLALAIVLVRGWPG